MVTRQIIILASCLLLAGCLSYKRPEKAEAPEKKPEPVVEKPKDKKGIIGKTTQDIGKYDPKAGHELQDSKIRASNPITAGAEAYGPMMQKVAVLGIDHSLALYNAEHGKWPTYEEFMKVIIKRNNMQLPVLPAKARYMYDEANHKLVVIKAPKKDADKEKE